jgi:hypothetical protein
MAIAACRQQSLPTLAEEQQAVQRVEARQRERTALNNVQRAKADRINPAGAKARMLTPAQAAGLEEELSKRPDEFEIRLELLQFYDYWAQKAGMEASGIVQLRRKHILWFIQSHPADDLCASPLLFVNTGPADPLADPEGYAQGKAAWLSQVEKNGSSAAVLGNAAYFMQTTDKPLAENFILQAKRLQPDGPWEMRLATLYGSMILGITAVRPASIDNPGLPVLEFQALSANTADQHTAVAESARRQMDAAKDFTLLLNVGRILLQVPNITVDFDREPLAVRYLQSAEALSTSSDQKNQVRFWLNEANDRGRQRRIRQLPKEGRYEAAMALRDRDRFELFWDLALSQYSHAGSFGPGNPDYLRVWDQTAQYAVELASVSKKFRNDPDYGNAVFNANMMLAYVESKKGHVDGTLDYIHEALKAPTASNGGDLPFWAQVCRFLIEQGNREDVIAFLERFAQIDPFKRDDLLATAARLRNGQTPDWKML